MKIHWIVRHVFLERYGVEEGISGNAATRPSMVIEITATVWSLNISGLYICPFHDQKLEIYIKHMSSEVNARLRGHTLCISQFKLFRKYLVGSMYQHLASHRPISLRSVTVHYINTSHEAQTKSYQISRRAGHEITETVKILAHPYVDTCKF